MSKQTDIGLFITPPHPCSYLPEKSARMLFVDPSLTVSGGLMSELSRQGYRRSGNYLYRPECKHCAQCLSLRIPVAQFKPGRTQRKIINKNADLTQRLVPSNKARAAHYRLYERYINQRHVDGDMYPPSQDQFAKFLMHGFEQSFFMEFWLGSQLVGVAVIDVLDDGLSAVYSFYNPALNSRSLGTYMIMAQIDWLKRIKKTHLYLGYWVPDAPKMRYKSRFTPFELFSPGGDWQWFEQAPTAAQIHQITQRRSEPQVFFSSTES